MVKKTIRFDMYIKTSEQTPTYSYVAKQKVMSNDKDSTQITFNLLDVSPDELSGSSASILLYMQDGSFFQSSDVTIDRNSVNYTMKEEETKHSGNTKVQIVLKKGTVQTASLIYNFEIEKGLEKYPLTEVMIQDWTTLTEEAKAFVEQIEGFTLEQFVENKMGQELANLEVNYATRLTGLEQKDNQLTAQLAQTELNKVDKSGSGQVTYANLSQDAREAMTGGSVAVVGTNAVLETNLTKNSIDFFRHYKDGFYPILMKTNPKNRFNKNTVTSGYYCNRSTGLLVASATYFASDYIPVYPTEVLIKNDDNQVAFFDENETPIVGIPTTSLTSGFTIPEGVYNIKISAPLTLLDTLQLELGNTPTAFEPYITNMNLLMTKGEIFTDGTITINTTAKTVTFNVGGLVLVNNYWYNFESQTVNINYTNQNEFICFNTETATFFGINGRGTAKATFDSKTVFIGHIIYGKFYSATNIKKITIDGVKNGGWGNEITNEITNKDRYTFTKCYKDWLGGLKSPITFLSDSTTDGDSTTGNTTNVIGSDTQDPNVYTTKLQTLLQAETGNNTLRIYNAGFSGKQADWALTNISAIMAPFADSKIIVIGYGINDRLTDLQDYYDTFYTRIDNLINWCFTNNYQPALMTSQATREIGLDTSITDARSGETVNSIANQVKKELANKYNLELIDVGKFSNMFLNYSAYPRTQISSDGLHFSDVGHEYESGMFFSHFVPRVTWISDKQSYLISLIDQKSKSDIFDEAKLSVGSGKFKQVFNYTRAETTELTLQDAWIFNATNAKITVTGYGNASVYVDGVLVTSGIGVELELGLHHLVAKTTSTTVNWEGFEVVPQ